MVTLTCKHCSQSFESKRKYRQFCNVDCFRQWAKGNINKSPKSIETKLKIAATQKGKRHTSEAFLSPDRGRKISKARKGMKFSDEHRQNLSNAKIRFLEAGGFHGKQSYYTSSKTGEINYAHSNFELEIMKQLDENPNVVNWTKNHHIRIPYEFNGQHMYLPDFKIEICSGLTILLEAKGYEFEPEKCVAKANAAKLFCDEKDWVYEIVHQNDMKE